MLHLRSVARLAPRAARSLFTQSIRNTLRTVPRPSIVNSSRTSVPAMRTALHFSTTSNFYEQEGIVNDELAAKLESELSMEKDMRDSDSLPSHLKEYLDNSSFKVEDKIGTEDVFMTREFGDEKIKISFSIQDLNEAENDADQMSEDPALMEEDDQADLPMETQSGGANTKGSVVKGRTPGGNFRVAPEDRVAPADREELSDEDDLGDEQQEPSFPAHLNIVVERPGKGALQFEAIAQDGLIVIEQVYYFKDNVIKESSSIDTADKAEPYTGPPFGNLDEDLQVLFEKYLEERGINTQLALFVPEYIDFKEQREYLTWLSGVKNFVE